MERWSDFRDAILSDFWDHLIRDHGLEEGYDIDVEYAIMQDYLLHGCEVKDDGIIEIKCDHCECNHTQTYQVTYYVTRIQEVKN